LADSAADKKAAKINKNVRVAVTFLITLLLIQAFLKSFIFQWEVGAFPVCLTRNLDLFRMPDYTPDLVHYQNDFSNEICAVLA
jgi:hypothetical protein